MKKLKDLPAVETVILPSILGKRPGFWLFIGLICVLLLIIFVLFFLPGIIKGGQYVTFSSSLTGVGVSVDGKYLGEAEGNQFFIASGNHEVVYRKFGIEIGREEIHIKHPVFLTLFLHPVKNVDAVLTGDSTLKEALSRTLAKDLNTWSAVTDYNEFYHYPPIITNAAKDAIALGLESFTSEMLLAAASVTSSVMLQDLEEATKLLESAALVYRSDAFDALLRTLPSVFDQSYTEIKLENKSRLVSPTQESIKGITVFTYPEQTITMGVNTIRSYPKIINRSKTIKTKPFSIGAKCVTEYEYALFLRDNPYWAKSNIETIVKDGNADEFYLYGMNPNALIPTDRPIRNISYNAAVAYCAYLSVKTGTQVRLPSEAEWEVMAANAPQKSYAQSLVILDMDATSPSGILGQVWEFTQTPFIPLARSTDYDEVNAESDKYQSTDVIIKGGSYANDKNAITAESIGVQSRTRCSEYTGFRVVLEK